LIGGAGGKGVWGKLGSELDEADVDMNDPNYDSDSLDNGDIELKTIIPEMSDEEIQVWEEFYTCVLVSRVVMP
jgi:programmed cell death protein 4